MVLNIVYDKSKVFNTNTRSPFLIFLEVFRPEEYFNKFRIVLKRDFKD